MNTSETSRSAAPPAADAGSSRTRIVRRLTTALVWTLAVLTVALPVTLCLRRVLAMDEYIYLHWAYEASRGVFAGADFFAGTPPFLQVVFAPVFWIEHATPERGAVLARVACALMGTASLWLAFYNYERVKGVAGTGVAPRFPLPALGIAAVCAGACDSFANRIVEVRPDNVYIFFLMLAVACFPESRHRARARISGALFACALLSSSKMAVVVAALIAAHLVAIVISREARAAARARVLGPHGRDFGLGLAVGIVAFGVITIGGHFRGAVTQIAALYAWAAGKLGESNPLFHGAGVEGYFTVIEAAGASIVVVALFALFGKQAHESDGGRRRLRWSPTYLGLLVAGAVSYGMQRSAWEYSRTLLFVVAVPVIVDGMATLLLGVLRLRVLAFAVEWALFFALAWHGLEQPPPRPSLDSQLTMLAEVRSATTSDDCVYDSSMTAFFRDHAHPHYLVVDGFMRATQRDKLIAEIPRAILDRGCVAMAADTRTPQMPQPILQFLDSHFVPVSPYLSFYGTRLARTATLAEPTDFHAPQASWYLADPPGATVRLAPDDPWAQRIWLERGDHKVLVSRPDTRLIWQPRDGAIKPPYRGRVDYRFSQL